MIVKNISYSNPDVKKKQISPSIIATVENGSEKIPNKGCLKSNQTTAYLLFCLTCSGIAHIFPHKGQCWHKCIISIDDFFHAPPIHVCHLRKTWAATGGYPKTLY